MDNKLNYGKGEHGCMHYQRRCKIRAPCCDQVFWCRHCHNSAKSAANSHTIVRGDVSQVICAVCDTEQQIAHICSSCGVKMGEYFCDICKFYDDNTTKEQFHCDACGICRVGGRENFFHCKKCASCYPINLQNNHPCVENSMKNECPLCCEYMFDSLKMTHVMNCGHVMHADCYSEMLKNGRYTCPICSKTVSDMEDMAIRWKRLDDDIAAAPMPEVYSYEVDILCNDCNNISKVPFHHCGHKCVNCKSYNTRVTRKHLPYRFPFPFPVSVSRLTSCFRFLYRFSFRFPKLATMGRTSDSA